MEKMIVTGTCQTRVTRPWRIRYADPDGDFSGRLTRTSRGDRAFFELAGIFSSGGESRYRRTTEEEFRVVPIAKRNGGLVVTILRTAGRYTNGMRDVLRALYVMSVHSKDALKTSLNVRYRHIEDDNIPSRCASAMRILYFVGRIQDL